MKPCSVSWDKFAALLACCFLAVLLDAGAASAQSACDQTYARARAQGKIVDTPSGLFVGVAVHVSGDVTIRGCRGSGRLRPGQKVVIDDRVRTGFDGRVRIEFQDRDDVRKRGPSVVNLGPSSEIHIDTFHKPRKETLIEMIRGSIRYFFKGSGGRTDSFSVRAGTSIAGMRGTDAVLFYNSDKNLLTGLLNEGGMVIQAGGKRTFLRPGEWAVVQGGVLGPKKPFKRENWDKLIQKFFGLSNPT